MRIKNFSKRSIGPKDVLSVRALNNHGIALLMVTWILMLLMVIVTEFCFSMRVRTNTTRNLKETTQAYYLAMAGVNQAIAEVVNNGGTPEPVTTVEGLTDDAKPVPWRVNTENPVILLGGGEFQVWIENQSGKIDINTADRQMLLLVLGDFELDDTEKEIIVDSILDWRDADDFHRTNGAEDDYYKSLPKPYEAKNADFENVEELLRVRGITPGLYFGGLEKRLAVFPADTAEPARKSRTASRTRRSRQSREESTGRLNINAISPALWAAFPKMDPDLISKIMEFRKEQDFKSISQLQEIVGPEVYQSVSRYLTTESSPYYTLHSIGRIAGSRITSGICAEVWFNPKIPGKYRIIGWQDEDLFRPPVADPTREKNA